MRPAPSAEVPTGMIDKAGRSLYDIVVFYGMTVFFGVLCVLWSVPAILFYYLLPRRPGTWVGQQIMMRGFRFYLNCLRALGAVRVDLSAIDGLDKDRGLVIVANHPSIVDVMLITSRLPRIVGIMKAELDRNFFLSGAARLARYIRNDSTRLLIKRAVDQINQGSQLLVFPEGTRTLKYPVNGFKAGFALIARQAGVDVQTVFIESDSRFLTKGWPLFKRPRFPLTYRLRLGRRFTVGDDTKAFTAELEDYFRAEMNARTGVTS